MTPTEDSFYAEPLIAPRPGELVRARSVDIATASPTTSCQVVYGSTSTLGLPVAMSGTVLVPRAEWGGAGPRPILAYGCGVHGLGRDHAPSAWLVQGSEHELPLIDLALDAGWAVAVADGEGLGMAGPHTYGAGRPGGHGLLDILRAAPSVPGPTGLRADAPRAIWGYSEGGRCAAWAAELAATYAPELPLAAVAAGGVPADLRELARHVGRGDFAGLSLAIVVGLAHAHRDPALWQVLTERGRRAAEVAAGLDVFSLVLEHPEPLESLTRCAEPWETPAWRAVLDAERNGRIAPGVPVLLYHSTNDDIVPHRVGTALAAGYRALGADVTWLDVPAVDHLRGGTDAACEVLGWLARRVGPFERAQPACA